MAEEPFHTLIVILREHDVPYDRDAIKAAFSDPESQTAIRAWMREYLSPETLLSKDELALYLTLSKTGEAGTIAAQDLSMVQGLNDQEIQNAIEELKRSTAAIEKHTEALKLQQNAMTSLVKNEKRTSQARAHTEKGQVRKWDAERGQINAEIEELSQSLKYQISDLEQQTKTSDASVKQNVDDILRSDDKLLLSLQKLASDLDPGRLEDDKMVERIRELCARLIKHTVEGIRTRLDRIYLNSLNSSGASRNGHDAESQEINDLQDELESLYSEILPVAQMSVQQQYLEPALRTIAATNGQGQDRSVKAVTYIHECMVFLANRLETFLERAEENQRHKMTLKFVVDSAKKELSRTETIPAKASSPIRSNTQRRKSSVTQQSPVRGRSGPRRSSGHEEDMEPEQQLARNLGISLPAEGFSDTARIDNLEKMLSERIHRLETHAYSLQSSTESTVSSHLVDAQTTLGLLQESLLAESFFCKVRLLDPEIESSIEDFERNIQDLREGLDAVDLHTLQAKNMHREKIIERWTR